MVGKGIAAPSVGIKRYFRATGSILWNSAQQGGSLLPAGFGVFGLMSGNLHSSPA